MTPTVEYMEMLRVIADRHNVTLIFDETITGLYTVSSARPLARTTISRSLRTLTQ